MRRIVVYRCGSLGDTIVGLPALRLVARAFPDSERWLLTNFNEGHKIAPMASVLEGTGLVHGYLEYPAGIRDARRLWRLRRDIRALGTDTLVYLTEPEGRWHTLRNAAFLAGCGLWRQIGVPWTRDRQRVRRLGANRWEPEAARQARCVARLGDAGVDDPRSYDLQLSTTERAEAHRLIESLAGRTLLAVSVGAKVDTKDWEDERWQPLLARLAQKYPDHGLVMIGSKDESARCEALGAPWQGRFVNLCGRLSVRASGAALARCSLFIGHDSGPMHLASAVGARCVAIFSSRNLPGEWFPNGERHRILYQSIECQGCRLDTCVAHQKRCIRSISVDMVMQAVDEILGSSSLSEQPSMSRAWMRR